MSAKVKLRADGMPWREVEGEVVALDLETSSYFAVNRTGAALWPALRQGATRGELIARLSDSFGVDHATAAEDVEVFLAGLREHGLLEE